MAKAIQQSPKFPASAKQLYKFYMDPKLHAAFTGGKVKITPKPDSMFSDFDGMLSGKMLLAVPGKQVVMRWRGSHWKNSDLDSILILTFVDEATGGRIDLTHVNVPEHDWDGVNEGWRKYYWEPLRAYLKAKV